MNMRYLSLISAISLIPATVLADEAALLQDSMTAYSPERYEGIKVIDNNGELEVTFPETTFFEFKNDDKGNLQTIENKIPEYKATAVKDGDFVGKDVYKITTTSIDGLRSDIYANFALHGAEATSY